MLPRAMKPELFGHAMMASRISKKRMDERQRAAANGGQIVKRIGDSEAVDRAALKRFIELGQ